MRIGGLVSDIAADAGRSAHGAGVGRAFCITASILSVTVSSPALAQITQPRIDQEMVDRFSVERKTGRFALSTGDVISIGGGKDSALSVSYGPVDGSDFEQRGIPRLIYNQVRKENTLTYYDYYTVEFNGISDTFRRETGTSAPLTTQYPTGSTLTTTSTNFIFTDKFGVVIDFGPYERVVSYPDGRELRFSGTSLGISFEGKDQTYRSAKNNFGYMLKFTAVGTHVDIQAVNLATDYCDPTSSAACTGLTQTRQASGDQNGGERTVTDASGGVTKYNFQQLYAFEYERICYTTGYITQCPDPPSWFRWYPVSVTMPGHTSPDYTVTYAKKGDVHDDIFVTSVQTGPILATYNTTKAKFGSWGSNPYNLAYYINTQVSIGGQSIGYSKAVRPKPEWGSARRSLVYLGDGLSRETNFSYNDLMEVSGETLPEGNGVTLTFDGRYNVTGRAVLPKPGSGLASQTTTFAYPASCTAPTLAFCNKPTSVTDPRGATTEYAYNSRGQILTETGAAPTVGAPRPKKVYSYTMRTAYVKDASSNVVAAGPAISMLTQMIGCDNTSACTGGGTDIVTVYDYGPLTGVNNLALRGVAITAMGSSGTIETHRNCYGYNYFGEKISETQPNGGLSSCP